MRRGAAADKRSPADTANWTLIYDGDCEFCRLQIDRLIRWDTRGRIDPIPFQRADLDCYGIDSADAAEAMYAVSPTCGVFRGAAAAREVFRLLPRARPLAWLLRLPGAMSVAESAYRWLAKRRHRFGCSSESCRRGVTQNGFDTQRRKRRDV